MSTQKKSCCCGQCTYDDDGDYYECSICLTPRCMAYQGSRPPPNSVCWNCIMKAEKDCKMHEIYPDGYNDDGLLIDPATKRGVPTCQICRYPSQDLYCSKLMLAMGNKCVRTGMTLKEFKAQKQI